MNWLTSLLECIRALLTWWFVVEPWEQAVRVRFGNRVALFHAGVHLRIPFFDRLYVQNTRRRLSGLPVQTLTTKDGKVLTLHGSIAYTITDVLKLHFALHDAEATIQQEAMALIAQYVAEHELDACTPEEIAMQCGAYLREDLHEYGLGEVFLFLTGYVANIRTLRLLQDYMSNSAGYSCSLTTRAPALPGQPATI